jgi:predicted TIM-barrel fold metal-dependent hydrolase
MTADYRLIDADTHFYEPRDAFTRFADPADHAELVRVTATKDGTEAILVGDRPLTFIRPPYDRMQPPGSLREVLKNLSTGEFQEERLDEPIRPEYVDRAARLASMDEQGVESCLKLPTLGGVVEQLMADDPRRTWLNLRAFNRWLDDSWGFGTDARIVATPMFSLLDLDAAVAELEWVLDRGARAIHLRPGPVGHRSPADPVFDPFWARVEEAGVAVVFHISESGYNARYSVDWSEPPAPTSWTISAFQWTCFYGDRPIMETMAALVLHNLFGRFPKLRVVSLENGSLWVPYLLRAMDKMKGMGRHGHWLGGRVEGRPSEIFREHVWVCPFHEEDVVALVDLVGPERVVFGSDFPHPEGLARPADFADLLGGLDERAVRRIMRDNARELLGLPG